MPSESRTLTFSNAEVIEALELFSEQAQRPLPEGGVKRLVFSNEREVKATVEPNSGDTPMHFYEHEIAAALILYCNKHGIPVARRAIKSLQVAQDAVVLQLALRS
jgi:hypothetical protein